MADLKERIQRRVSSLLAEPIYEGGEKANGIADQVTNHYAAAGGGGSNGNKG